MAPSATYLKTLSSATGSDGIGDFGTRRNAVANE